MSKMSYKVQEERPILTINKTSFATCGMTEDLVTGRAGNHRLGVAEDSGDIATSLTLDIHKVRVRSLNETLLLVHGLLGGW